MNPCQLIDHLLARLSYRQQRHQLFDDILCGEVTLDQLRHHALACDQIHHRHMIHRYQPLGNGKGQGRDAVDHHKGIADQSRFYRRCAARHYGSSRMKERRSRSTCGGANCAFGTKVINHADSKVLTELIHHFPGRTALKKGKCGGKR